HFASGDVVPRAVAPQHHFLFPALGDVDHGLGVGVELAFEFTLEQPRHEGQEYHPGAENHPLANTRGSHQREDATAPGRPGLVERNRLNMHVMWGRPKARARLARTAADGVAQAGSPNRSSSSRGSAIPCAAALARASSRREPGRRTPGWAIMAPISASRRSANAPPENTAGSKPISSWPTPGGSPSASKNDEAS